MHLLREKSFAVTLGRKAIGREKPWQARDIPNGRRADVWKSHQLKMTSLTSYAGANGAETQGDKR
ncbi:MAG: hypothetical protein H6Q33_3394 [Deltaproteobacteria bacterium]|nr:hypothetical protein [Deltaproteobacteria bacterium]